MTRITAKTWRRALLLLSLGTLCSTAVLLLGRSSDSGPENAAAIAKSLELLPRVSWPEGQRQVFHLSYQSNDEVRPIVDDSVISAAAVTSETPGMLVRI